MQYHSKNPENGNALIQLRMKLFPIISAHGIPAGIDENYRRPGDGFELQASAATPGHSLIPLGVEISSKALPVCAAAVPTSPASPEQMDVQQS
jgi:hypothetical protein